MKKFVITYIRPIAIAVAAPVVGFLILFVVEKLFKIEFSRLTSSLINLVVVGFFVFIFLPKRLGEPYDRLKNPRLLGLYLPSSAFRHILLGVALAVCTLSGMLAASILIGGYTPDWQNITISHLVYSLNPALWEELLYRGFLMFVLLRFNQPLKKAAAIQIIIFGLAHIKGFQFWDFVDVFSVALLAIAFTYSAYKTRTLLAGIVFHYFHDAFVFFVQLPQDTALANAQNLLFFGLLWGMVAVALLVIKISAERLGVQADTPLYLEPPSSVDEAQLTAATSD